MLLGPQWVLSQEYAWAQRRHTPAEALAACIRPALGLVDLAYVDLPVQARRAQPHRHRRSTMTAQSLDSNYARAGFHNRLGFGVSPALVMVDFAQAYFERGSPLYAGVEAALASALRVREAAHRARVPVILTRVLYKKGGVDGGIFFRKTPPLACFEEGNPLGDWAQGLQPQPDEIVLTKQYPSAFFNTGLAAMLTTLRVDTVLLTGLSTSGCVRATCVDACSSGFRPIVIREAVGDRDPRPHEANLYDMNAKYGDVVEEAECLDYLRAPSVPRI
jgi:maleamate amidohydrolase